jgi:hypothetical protein
MMDDVAAGVLALLVGHLLTFGFMIVKFWGVH